MTTLEAFQSLRTSIATQIVGQPQLIDRLLIALLADGHILVEGAPGLAKTKAVKTLSQGLEATFQRIQFTPDLLPADLTGTDIFRPQSGEFQFQQGPLFHNIVLADEINRAPAKVQSALLEAMAERQITVGSNSYTLPQLFMVMATQNPIEQEGTYPLPEAQLDRFLLHVVIDYPNASAEREILRLSRAEANSAHQPADPSQTLSQETVFQARLDAMNVSMIASLEDYLIELVLTTRDARKYSDKISQWIRYGASPRASIALDRCARAHAWLNGRDYVTADDVQAMAFDVLRHRILLSFEAEAQGITPDQVIKELINSIPAP